MKMTPQTKEQLGPTFNVIPNRLLELFRKNFEVGLNNAIERPTMAEWFDTLNLANNELLKCGNQKCNLIYPFNNNKKCPFCGHTPHKVTRIQMERWEETDPLTACLTKLNRHLI